MRLQDDFEDYEEFDDDADDLVVCAECGSEVYALGDRCPECGYWMVQGVGAKEVNLARPHRNTKLVADCLLIVFAVLMFLGFIVPLFR